MESGFQNGDLTVLGLSNPPTNKHGQRLWDVKCACGVVKPMRADHIRRLKSCGCKRVENAARSNMKHGHSTKGNQTSEYRAWLDARDRCTNPKNPVYDRYGGRGIKMCKRWFNDFSAFLFDVGPRPYTKMKGYKRYWSLDRIDNSLGYEPGNVRWTDPTTQASNRG